MSMSESATGCVGRGLLVEGSSGEGRAWPAAMRAANWHAPFLRRQLSHFWSFGAARGHFPSLAGAPLRFIGAKRPSLRGVRARGPAPHAGHNRNAGKQLALMRSHIPKIGARSPVTLRYSAMNADVAFLRVGSFLFKKI